jgi:tRNA C32,U32 (ribose-2'-O)-methylase TrmJ
MYACRDLTLDGTQHPDDPHQRADEEAVEGLHEQFAAFLDDIGHPAEKQAKATRLWRRFVGRARPTGREVQTLRGLFRRAGLRIEHGPPSDDDDG